MSAATLHDTGAPTIEVLIYRNRRLLAREPSGAETAPVAEQRPGVDAPPGLDALEPDSSVSSGDEDRPLGSQQLPGYGTE